MISLLLKLFPARFVEDLGSDWEADTRQELQDAKCRGALSVVAWFFKTLGGTLVGAFVSHSHEIKLALSSVKSGSYVLSAGSRAVRMRAKEPPSWGFWCHASIAWLGAALAGHLLFSVSLPVWFHGHGFLLEPFRAGDVWSGVSSFMGMMPFFAKVCGVGLGVYLALSFRLKSNIPGLGGLASLSLLVLCLLAFSSSHLTWMLLDLGKRAQGVAPVFKEFPMVRENMGLPEGEAASPAQCEKAVAVFSVASSGWSRAANNSGDLTPFILLKGLGRDLLMHGCWTEAQFLSAHLSWEQDASLILSDRRFLLHLPELREGGEQALSHLSLSRQQWCVLREERNVFLGSERGVQEDCQAVQRPRASVHSSAR